MKIAVSSTGQGLKSQSSQVFGRCPWFVIVETDGKKIIAHKDVQNNAAIQAAGAGIASAQLVGNEGATVVISGAVGPRAFSVFQQVGIEAYLGTGGTVEENVMLFISGKLSKINTPGVMGTGMGGGFNSGTGRGMGLGRGGGFGAGRGMGRRQ
ncbi:MAG: NifB/NifX family molybdenum-iron cluster-binding protein [Candidatus Aenigmarchaeota archaeon]|nr:NifB/NifX family molybdenum-iron cluster-binding protein [Candidatus Aenigmarchaeota archaeon]